MPCGAPRRRTARVTSAVAACGLGEIRTKAELQDRKEILEAGGAVISPFLPDQMHAVYTPLVQNEVLSGLSMATIVLGAFGAPFARKHVEVAMKQGKTIFIAEHLIPKVGWARRCVEEGVYGTQALIFTSPEEITKRWEETHRPTRPTDEEAIEAPAFDSKPDTNPANPTPRAICR